jgi:flagellum-specific ATP synthase
MERAGKEEGKGSITAFFTVLIEGDDMSDPIADQSRSILDGHIVLSREMTDFGIYPPVHILNSASRVMNDIIDEEHFKAVIKFRRYYTLLKENEVLIRIGAYTQGSDRELDAAIAKKEQMEAFISQDSSKQNPFEDTKAALINVMKET